MSNLKIFTKTILVPVVLGGIVGFIISRFMDYNALQKPFLSPPSILFPIMWTIFYILMGVSYGILTKKQLNDQKVSSIYYLQLGINLIWPILFFVFKWRLFSFLWLMLLIVFIIIMIKRFYGKDKVSGLIQIPYLIWSLFASYLNIFIYLLNR